MNIWQAAASICLFWPWIFIWGRTATGLLFGYSKEDTKSPGGNQHADLSYPSDGDGHAVASVDFVALDVQGQRVQGDPEDVNRKTWLLTH